MTPEEAVLASIIMLWCVENVACPFTDRVINTSERPDR